MLRKIWVTDNLLIFRTVCNVGLIILTAGEQAPSTSTPEEFSNVLTTFSLPENAAKCKAVKLDSVARDLSMA